MIRTNKQSNRRTGTSYLRTLTDSVGVSNIEPAVSNSTMKSRLTLNKSQHIFHAGNIQQACDNVGHLSQSVDFAVTRKPMLTLCPDALTMLNSGCRLRHSSLLTSPKTSLWRHCSNMLDCLSSSLWCVRYRVVLLTPTRVAGVKRSVCVSVFVSVCRLSAR